jgi:diguanylate cyclase (GGDEF)-like protein
MSPAEPYRHVPDPVVVYDRDGVEQGRNDAALAVFGDAGLASVLTGPSWTKLADSLATPRSGIEVVANDGSTWDVTVGHDGPEVLVALRDVSRYTHAASKLTDLTHELAARQRDLQTLYDASVDMASSQTLEELGQSTSRLLCRYLGASHVQVTFDDESYTWPDSPPSGRPDGTSALSAARATVGRLAWWRSEPLDSAERRLIDLIGNRVAVGLERTRLMAETRYLADHDATTGLLNRTGGMRRLQAVAFPAALVMLDIDNFKQINDQHGHVRGDQLLERFAEVLLHFRATDLVVRWGGEEFLLILPATNGADAVDPIDRLRRRVREAVHVAGTPITFSAGIADLPDVDDFDPALRAADDALYAAKEGGRDRVVLAEEPLRTGC